jgi:hypothetical protein
MSANFRTDWYKEGAGVDFLSTGTHILTMKMFIQEA